jgi:YD repeat-containing protein
MFSKYFDKYSFVRKLSVFVGIAFFVQTNESFAVLSCPPSDLACNNASQDSDSGNVPGTYALPGDGVVPDLSLLMATIFRQPVEAKHLAGGGAKGDLTYSLSLSLPPSLLAPSLSLDYSAGGGPGYDAGYAGWNLGGITEIARPTEPAYTGLDAYRISGALNGILIKRECPGGSCLAGYSYYVLKSADSKLVLADYDNLQGADTWSVRLGFSTMTLKKVGANDRYRVTEVRDNYLNNIVYAYDASGRINTIQYGGATTTNGNVKIHFNFGSAAKAWRQYANGGKLVFDKILMSVDISVDKPTGSGKFIRANAYRLVDTAADGGVDELTEIVHEGYDTTTGTSLTQSQPLASFAYSGITTGAREVYVAHPAWTDAAFGSSITTEYRRGTGVIGDPKPEGRTKVPTGLLDLNCDGIADKVTSGDTGFVGASVDLKDIASSTAWTISPGHAYGTASNGLEKYIDWSATPYKVAGPAAAIHETLITPWSGTSGHSRTISQILDVDGDGIPDLLVSKGSMTWDVYYGNCGTTLFDKPVHLPAPLLYSASSQTHPVDLGDSVGQQANLQDGEWEMRDMNGDGLPDIFVAASRSFFAKIPGRSNGWAATATAVVGFPANSLSTVEQKVIYDPVQLKIDPAAPLSTVQRVVSETELSQTIQDINGDGLPDYIDASGGKWTVRYGKGSATQGGPMEFDAPVSWDAPMAYVTSSVSGYPMTFYRQKTCVEVEREGAVQCPTKTYPGTPPSLTQELLDIDGDGKPDLATTGAKGRHWYRNTGAGFETTARTLPSWMPDSFSQQGISLANSAFGGANDPHTTGYLSGSSSLDTVAVQDLDGDHRIDTLQDNIGINFGKSEWPFLLIAADNKRGLASTMQYRSTASMEPSGLTNAWASPSYPTPTMTSHRTVVSSISSADSLTGQTAQTTFDYSFGDLNGGVFRGFANRTAKGYVNNALLWQQKYTYELHRDYPPLVLTQSVTTDANLCHIPGLSSSSCSFPILSERFGLTNTYAAQGTWGERLLLNAAAVKRTGEAPGSVTKTANYSYSYDPAGKLVYATYDGGGDPGTSSETTIAYASNAAGDLFLPSMIYTTHTPVKGGESTILKYTNYYYDQRSDNTLTNGSLTRVRQLAGPQASWSKGFPFSQLVDTLIDIDTRGQVKKIASPIGSYVSTAYGYNGAIPISTTNNLGHATSATVDVKGRVVQRTEATGVSHSYDYDDLDRLTASYIKGRTAKSYVQDSATTYQTSTIPNWVWSRTTVPILGQTLPASQVYKDFDGGGNIMRTWTPNPNSPTQWVKQDHLYDLRGLKIESGMPVQSDKTHSPGDALDTHVTLSKANYDAFGAIRESWIDYGLSGSRNIGHVKAPPAPTDQSITIDDDGYQKRLIYNSEGNIVEVDELQSGSGVSEAKTGDYVYDALGQLTKINLSNGDTYRYDYDAAGRVVAVYTGKNGTATNLWHSFTYGGTTALPSLALYTRRTDADGKVHEITGYDPLGRVTSYKVTNGTGFDNYTATYDTNLKGAIATTADPGGGETFTYDDYGNRQTTTRFWSQDSVTKTFSYTYDHLGRELTEMYPSGLKISNYYSVGGGSKIESDVVPVTGSAVTFTMDYYLGMLNRVSASIAGSTLGAYVDYGRGSPGTGPSGSISRINTIAYGFGANQFKRAFTYSPMNRKASTKYQDYSLISGPTSTHTYTYDHLQRLNSDQIDGATKTKWTYDNDGGDLATAVSLTPIPSTFTYAYPAPGSAAAAKGLRKPDSRSGATSSGYTVSESYTYDNSGRLTTWNTGPIVTGGALGPQRTIEYDGLGRIVALKVGAMAAQTNSYDFAGARIQSLVNAPGKPNVAIQRFGKWMIDNSLATAKATENVNPLLAYENDATLWKLSELTGEVGLAYSTLPSVQNTPPTWRRVLSASGELATFAYTGTPPDDERESFHGGFFQGVPGGVDFVSLGVRDVERRDGQWSEPEPMLIFGAAKGRVASPAALHPYRYAANNPVLSSDPSGWATPSDPNYTQTMPSPDRPPPPPDAFEQRRIQEANKILRDQELDPDPWKDQSTFPKRADAQYLINRDAKGEYPARDAALSKFEKMAGVDAQARAPVAAGNELTTRVDLYWPEASVTDPALPAILGETSEMGAVALLPSIALSLTSHGDPIGAINGFFNSTFVLRATGGALRKDLSFVGVDTTKLGLFPPSQFPAFSQ